MVMKIRLPVIDHLKPAESVRNVHHAMIPAGVPYERVFDREFWSHVAGRLQRGERVEVEPTDRSYCAELRVDEVGPTWVKMVQLTYVDLVKARIAAEEIQRRLDLASAEPQATE